MCHFVYHDSLCRLDELIKLKGESPHAISAFPQFLTYNYASFGVRDALFEMLLLIALRQAPVYSPKNSEIQPRYLYG